MRPPATGHGTEIPPPSPAPRPASLSAATGSVGCVRSGDNSKTWAVSKPANAHLMFTADRASTKWLGDNMKLLNSGDNFKPVATIGMTFTY